MSVTPWKTEIQAKIAQVVDSTGRGFRIERESSPSHLTSVE